MGVARHEVYDGAFKGTTCRQPLVSFLLVLRFSFLFFLARTSLFLLLISIKPNISHQGVPLGSEQICHVPVAVILDSSPAYCPQASPLVEFLRSIMRLHQPVDSTSASRHSYPSLAAAHTLASNGMATGHRSSRQNRPGHFSRSSRHSASVMGGRVSVTRGCRPSRKPLAEG